MLRTSEWLLSFSSQSRSVRQDFQYSTSNHRCKKISVTGGKGGVGKTSVSLRLAQDLARQNYRVLLIDCDTNLSNTAIKLGLPLDNTFWKLLAGEIDFHQSLTKVNGFDLLPACNGSIDLFDSQLPMDEVMIDIISAHESEYDFIVLDSPAGMSKESLNLNAYSDSRLIVVTPDRSSITDSYSLVKVLSQKYAIKENHLLMNMVQNEKQFQRVSASLSETIENFVGARTIILGGVKKIEIPQESFDHFFLAASDEAWNQNFFKVTHAFADKPATVKVGDSRTESTFRREQEVH